MNKQCAGLSNRPHIKHQQVTPNDFDYLMMLESERLANKAMTDNEDKFSQFFLAGKLMANPLSDAELIEHIEALEEVVLEGKAHLSAAKWEQRDRGAKKTLGGNWTISPTGPDQVVSDSINKVELRQKRMTKLDKQTAKFRALGFTQAEIDAMTTGLRAVAAADTQEEKQKIMNREKLLAQSPATNFTSPLASLFGKKSSSPETSAENPNPNGNEKGMAVPTIKPNDEAPVKPIDFTSLFKKD
ncbi:MAG: hypothetical protein ABWY25_01490 [Paenisporosarcina sp.]